MTRIVFTVLLAILGLGFNRHFAYASKSGMCSEHPCHEEATCLPIGSDRFECKCNGLLIGDGISACDVPRVPKEVTRVLKGKKKKKKNACACEGLDTAAMDGCCNDICGTYLGCFTYADCGVCEGVCPGAPARRC